MLKLKAKRGWVEQVAGVVERFHRRMVPVFHRVENLVLGWGRRLRGAPRGVVESPNLLPVLIKVLAGFTKVDGDILEEEIDSSLGFLRYDYPDTVYSELRTLYRQALQEQQDLDAMAARLRRELPPDQKLLLCVQLYDLISKAGLQPGQVAAFYDFMAQMGIVAEAVDIVYQLNTDGQLDPIVEPGSKATLETLVIGREADKADVVLRVMEEGERLCLYRYHDLMLLKNLARTPVHVRGRAVPPGGFCRIYPGQRLVMRGHVLGHQDLAFYFNAKKGVSIPEVYLRLVHQDEVEVLRSRERDAFARISFGLSVRVEALAEIDAELLGRRLQPGVTIDASLDDAIVFHGDSRLELGDLRRRARAMGGRFALKPGKREYLVSNNPGLLGEHDILLSPGTSGEVLLRIRCDFERLGGRLEVLHADRPIVLRGEPVRNAADLHDGDIIRIDAGQVLRCDFTERIIEERRNIIRSLEARDLRVRFANGEVGLDAVSFDVRRGEMVCVMGASGSGKSTLLQTLAGQLPPSGGDVFLNGLSLYPNLDRLKGYISFVPQDDAFDEHLTVEENLDYAAAVRAPHLSARERRRRVADKLAELGLSERRESLVGSQTRKKLSGGERKRLNIGLDMIGSSDVYLFDEPTSGLSSKDSEHIIDIIRGISHNKIVLVTIHQPSAKLFHMFQKALLLDKGGKLVFYGMPDEMLRYFAAAEHEQHHGIGAAVEEFGEEVGPEFVFDVIETPLRDLSGDVIYEEGARGQLVPARRFSPEYWRDKFESYRLLRDVQQVSVHKSGDMAPDTVVVPTLRQARIRWHDEWAQFKAQVQRAFLSKLRNRANILTTMVEAPMLAALFGLVLRYSESGDYDFGAAFHIPTYLFLALVVGMFLGLTNSADDIIRDRPILFRQRNLSIRLWYFILAKVMALALFALLQCILFVFIGSWILDIRGVFWMHVGYLFATSLSGVAIGLLISSLVSDAKTAANILPLILIPQIILGGALIKYEEMNRNLDFRHVLERWRRNHPGEQTAGRVHSDLEVPWISQWMPLRWSYEALIVDQAKNNPLTRRQRAMQEQVKELATRADEDPEAARQLEFAKQALAAVSGLEGSSPAEVEAKLRLADRLLKGEKIPLRNLLGSGREVSAEQLFVNQKVSDLVSTAEMEQNDYTLQQRVNVFFGPVKWYFGREWSVCSFNMAVLNFSTIGFLLLVHASLARQLEVRTILPRRTQV